MRIRELARFALKLSLNAVQLAVTSGAGEDDFCNLHFSISKKWMNVSAGGDAQRVSGQFQVAGEVFLCIVLYCIVFGG
jgi:hypothetical protein